MFKYEGMPRTHTERETSARVLIADNVHMGLSKLPLIALD